MRGVSLEHIQRLQAKLVHIYTYADGKRFDIREELEKFNYLEKVYSTFVEKAVKEGETYTDYNKYLTGVRERINKLDKIKEEIEEKNAAEIMNIKLLIELFSETH